MAAIQISGYLANNTTPFNYEIRPNDITTTLENVGEDVRAYDGTTHRFHRAYKRNFKFSFNNVREATVTDLYTVFTIPNQYIFQDIDGTKYTVLTEANSFDKTLDANSVSLRGVKLYTVSIGLIEV